MARKSRCAPQADSVTWMGLCPCGCGAYKAVLLDVHGKPIAYFGWDREGWGTFMLGVMREIDEESDEAVCSHHPTH